MPPLIECHAHVRPDTALARFPGGTSARYVTAERRVLLKVLGPDRLLVGNDQPPVWFPRGESLAPLERLPLSAGDREAVRWRNAARLFGLEPRTLVLSPP